MPDSPAYPRFSSRKLPVSPAYPRVWSYPRAWSYPRVLSGFRFYSVGSSLIEAELMQ